MRRRRAEKRELIPDVKYDSMLVARLINTIMIQGKKATAQKIVYGALEIIKTKKPDVQAIEVFNQALENVKPKLEVKSRRVGGATYQVPVEIKGDPRYALAMRWLIAAARARGGKTMAEKLAGELTDAAHNTGNTIKKREDTHRMAEANKAFSHYRW